MLAYDLQAGAPLYPALSIPRAEDRGLRMAAVRLVPALGVVYLSETVLAWFDDDCSLRWRKEDDFSGWTIEGITLDEVLLLSADWTGNEQRQARSLATGDVIG